MMGHGFYSSFHPSMWGFGNTAVSHANPKSYTNGFSGYHPSSVSPKDLKQELRQNDSFNNNNEQDQNSQGNASPVSSSAPESTPSPTVNHFNSGHILSKPRPTEGAFENSSPAAATSPSSPGSVTSSTASTAYPYFTPVPANSGDLASPLYGSYSTTGVFAGQKQSSNKPKSKSKANTGKNNERALRKKLTNTKSGDGHIFTNFSHSSSPLLWQLLVPRKIREKLKNHFFSFQKVESAWIVAPLRLRSGVGIPTDTTCATLVDCTTRWTALTGLSSNPRGKW